LILRQFNPSLKPHLDRRFAVRVRSILGEPRGRVAAALNIAIRLVEYEVRSGIGAGGSATVVETSPDGPDPGAMVMVSPALA
jgi:hypothetical protein